MFSDITAFVKKKNNSKQKKQDPLPLGFEDVILICDFIYLFCWQVVKNGLEKGRVEGYKKEAEVNQQ